MCNDGNGSKNEQCGTRYGGKRCRNVCVCRNYYFTRLITDIFQSRYKIRGLDLILTSINCQQYKSLFESYGINEYTIVNMTDSDLKHMNVNEKDIATIMNAINVLNKSLSYHEVRFT